MSFPTRKQAQKNIKKDRRNIYFRNNFKRIFLILKFFTINIALSFIISVVAFDFVSSEYDTLQVKEEILKDNITTTFTEIRGIDGMDIPFNIEFIDFETVKLGEMDTEYINIKFRIIQNKYPNDALRVIIDNTPFDNLEEIQFRIKEKRENPTNIQLILSLKESNERVGYAIFDINQNFKRNIEAKLEVNAKSRFSNFIHNITNVLIEIL